MEKYLPSTYKDISTIRSNINITWRLLFTKGKWNRQAHVANIIGFLPKGFSCPSELLIYGDSVAIV